MNDAYKYAIAMILSVALMSCIVGYIFFNIGEGKPSVYMNESDDMSHITFEDEESGVNCYLYEHSGYAGGAIECMPGDSDSGETTEVSYGESVLSNEPNIIRTVYTEKEHVCYTYTHSGYAGGDMACMDINDTTLTLES